MCPKQRFFNRPVDIQYNKSIFLLERKRGTETGHVESTKGIYLGEWGLGNRNDPNYLTNHSGRTTIQIHCKTLILNNKYITAYYSS